MSRPGKVAIALAAVGVALLAAAAWISHGLFAALLTAGIALVIGAIVAAIISVEA